MFLSFAQKHFALFFPLSFVFSHSWDLSVISQIITELVIKSCGRNKKKPTEALGTGHGAMGQEVMVLN